MQAIKLSRGSKVDKNEVIFHLRSFGRDFILEIYGGEAHIGSLALSDKIEKKEHQLTLNIHKEKAIVKKALAELKDCFQTELLVLCGIHYDDISKEEIQQILEHVDEMIMELKAAISRRNSLTFHSAPPLPS